MKRKSIYDIETIVDGRGLDIWHGDDPLIKTHEIQTWNRRKNHLYTAVYHFGRRANWVQLADKTVPDVSISHNASVILATVICRIKSNVRGWNLSRLVCN